MFAALSMRAEVVVIRSKLDMTVLNLSCISHTKNAVLDSSIRAVLNMAAVMVGRGLGRGENEMVARWESYASTSPAYVGRREAMLVDRPRKDARPCALPRLESCANCQEKGCEVRILEGIPDENHPSSQPFCLDECGAVFRL